LALEPARGRVGFSAPGTGIRRDFLTDITPAAQHVLDEGERL
jgi:hypothetical protein